SRAARFPCENCGKNAKFFAIARSRGVLTPNRWSSKQKTASPCRTLFELSVQEELCGPRYARTTGHAIKGHAAPSLAGRKVQFPRRKTQLSAISPDQDVSCNLPPSRHGASA